MTKQAIIESLLDTWLSNSELEYIEKGWNAFYNNPLKYKNTIVADMVLQSIIEKRKPFYFSADIAETNPELMNSFFSENQLKEVYRDIIDKTEYKDFSEWFFDMLKSGLIIHR